MNYITEKELQNYEKLAEKRRAEIRATKDEIAHTGTVYYVSENGDDANDGLEPAAAWRSIARVSEAELVPGDTVLFERGGVYRGALKGKEGITYAAYGSGDKPKLYASPCDAARCGRWEKTDVENVYAYDRELRDDVGTLVFNDGESCARKVMKLRVEKPPFVSPLRRLMGLSDDVIPSFNLETGERFIDYHDLCHDLDFFHDYMGTGKVYLYSDKGNPAERFDGIELLVKQHVIRMAKDTHLDNLCIKYGGAHGACGGTYNITITNCEFGWIGGSIQGEAIFGRPNPTRYGNAVELYGSCYNFTVDNCLFYQIYDAAITHQSGVNGDNQVYMFNVAYTNNLIETSSYSIEYFLGGGDAGNPSHMKDILYKNNFCRNAGFGWGHQRPDKDTPSHIKGWESINRAQNFVIEDNIFELSRYMLMQCGTELPVFNPILKNNTYIQYEGGQFGMIGERGVRRPFDGEIESVIREKYGDKDAKIYFVKPE